MSLASRFNRSAFARFLNSPAGRLFRLGGGMAFLALGAVLLTGGSALLGIASIAWGLLALSAGGLDICWVSAVLGGPLSGAACRADATRR